MVGAFHEIPDEVRSAVRAVSVGAQQHGCVALSEGPEYEVLADARLWCDVTSAPEADRLNALADFPNEIGSRLVASFTITKLSATPPSTAAVCLPHDWLTWRLTGRLVTDRGDASGSGWWSSQSGIRRDLLALTGRPKIEVPVVLGADESAGEVSADAAATLGLRPDTRVAAGSGDNMAAALGVGAREGEVVISLGTSGTVFAVSARPTADPTGLVAGFADATGRYLPLVCTLNCTTPLDTFARWFGFSLADALDRANRGTNLVFLPYLKGERTPDLPAASGVIHGLREDSSPDELLAAAVQGAAAGLATGLTALVGAGLPAPSSLLLVGGGSRHPTWLGAIADATGLAVACPEGDFHAARGMAAQARAALDGGPVRDVAEAWRPGASRRTEPRPRSSSPVDRARLLDAMRPLWTEP
jgi:xylulokinase